MSLLLNTVDHHRDGARTYNQTFYEHPQGPEPAAFSFQGELGGLEEIFGEHGPVRSAFHAAETALGLGTGVPGPAGGTRLASVQVVPALHRVTEGLPTTASLETGMVSTYSVRSRVGPVLAQEVARVRTGLEKVLNGLGIRNA